ncbi:hypothetical protein RBH92_00940 [Nitrosomonas sp. sh817]|nr:hypothetical protein [Nitrosomonas sp. sh817]WMJ08800.1 hypothetical protein RBH92_00940 [Nitrosomonas sp. sh817]
MSSQKYGKPADTLRLHGRSNHVLKLCHRRYRRVVGVGGAGFAAITLRGFSVCVLQPHRQSHSS